MKILNVGAGYPRPQGAEWVNLDQLYDTLFEGTEERKNLDAEGNYVNHHLPAAMPFGNGSFDGIACFHVLEHFNCMEAVTVIADCYRLLRSGGVLLVSVPDATYFRQVQGEDSKPNAPLLFGEPMQEIEPKQSFRDYALFFGQHRQVFCEDSMWALLRQGGFEDRWIRRTSHGASRTGGSTEEPLNKMKTILTRIQFSLLMTAQKGE